MTTERDRKLLVMGNGPSLKGFQFERSEPVDTLGMNAAYRYWDRIGWYPTHYCCVDDQLIETHHAEIFRLLEKGQVESVFTLAKILEFEPRMADMEGVYFREQFHGTLARKLEGLGSGKPHIAHKAFHASDASKLTTGSFAVRYGIFQGYTDIGLMGIDLEYVEILPEAKRGDGLKLVIADEVKSNPNYFFDDYQRKGDRFNIPNPAEHDGNLHVQAFEVLRDDLAIQGLDVRVENLNRSSRLHDLGIFPTSTPQAFLGEAGIGAIAVPTTRFEVADICRNIALWDQPAYHPVTRRSDYGRYDLAFVFSQPAGGDIRAEVMEAWNATTFLKHMFAGGEPKFLSAGLADDVDIYQREYVTKHGDGGFKSGPNLQFFRSMELLGKRYRDFVFFMETDCAPVRAGWLSSLNDMAEGDRESWVIGSPYRGVAQLSKAFFMHLNGNALYRVGSPAFQSFLRKTWKPLLDQVIATEDPRAAYDCILSRHWSKADSHDHNDNWRSYQANASKFRASEAIVNISGTEDLARCDGDSLRDYLNRFGTAQVLHGRHFTRSLYAAMAEDGHVSPGTVRLKAIEATGETRAAEFDPGTPAEMVLMPEGNAKKLDEASFSLTAEEGNLGRILLIFDARIDVEDVFTLTLTLEASQDCRAALGLSRHGKTDFEGNSVQLDLKAGQQTVAVSNQFARPHARLRGQITVLEGACDITVTDSDLSHRPSWWPAELDRQKIDGLFPGAPFLLEIPDETITVDVNEPRRGGA